MRWAQKGYGLGMHHLDYSPRTFYEQGLGLITQIIILMSMWMMNSMITKGKESWVITHYRVCVCVCECVCVCVCVLVTQLCLTLWDPMDCSLPGSSVHGILQAVILEWVAMPFSWASSQLRDRTCVSCIDRQVLYHWATREAQFITLPNTN